MFENSIGAHLCSYFEDVSYWREGNAEVDFVVKLGKQIVAIEVKSGRKKTTSGLKKFKEFFPSSKSVLLDYQLGEQFLLASDRREFISRLI